MANNMGDIDFERLWRKLQQIGLNGYEARTYLVLVGHPQFKALELATRANVPRQKIYEVVDSLVEKGFALVCTGEDQVVFGHRAWLGHTQLPGPAAPVD